jgi:hypothetical protein
MCKDLHLYSSDFITIIVAESNFVEEMGINSNRRQCCKTWNLSCYSSM